jgi:hypothetical protein
MLIPAGTHKVEFKFEPKQYAIGEKISLAGSITLLIACIGIFFMELKGAELPKE